MTRPALAALIPARNCQNPIASRMNRPRGVDPHDVALHDRGGYMSFSMAMKLRLGLWAFRTDSRYGGNSSSRPRRTISFSIL